MLWMNEKLEQNDLLSWENWGKNLTYNKGFGHDRITFPGQGTAQLESHSPNASVADAKSLALLVAHRTTWWTPRSSYMEHLSPSTGVAPLKMAIKGYKIGTVKGLWNQRRQSYLCLKWNQKLRNPKWPSYLQRAGRSACCGHQRMVFSLDQAWQWRTHQRFNIWFSRCWYHVFDQNSWFHCQGHDSATYNLEITFLW